MPLGTWGIHPEVPFLEDGMICASGSADDKRQFYMYVKAISEDT